MVFLPKRTPKVTSPLSSAGGKFQIFDLWYIQSQPSTVESVQDEAIIVASEFWVMVSSTSENISFGERCDRDEAG